MKRFSPSFVALSLLLIAFTAFQCQKEHGDTGTDGDDQYVKYTVGSLTENFVSPSDSFTTSKYNASINFVASPKIFVDSASWQFSIFNISNITSPGNYTLDAGSLLVSRGSGTHFSVYYNDSGPMTVNITEYGNTGGYITGSFSGTFRDFNSGALVAGSCIFRLKRRF
jgi:hypothetical protein